MEYIWLGTIKRYEIFFFIFDESFTFLLFIGLENSGKTAILLPVKAAVSNRRNCLRAQCSDVSAFLKFWPLMQYKKKFIPKLM